MLELAAYVAKRTGGSFGGRAGFGPALVHVRAVAIEDYSKEIDKIIAAPTRAVDRLVGSVATLGGLAKCLCAARGFEFTGYWRHTMRDMVVFVWRTPNGQEHRCEVDGRMIEWRRHEAGDRIRDAIEASEEGAHDRHGVYAEGGDLL
jgi:hypothetical protein